MTPDPRQAVIDRYSEGGPILAQAAAGLLPEVARARPIPGTWSLAEIVAHLTDTDLVLADRMKRVIAEDDPPLAAFAENAWIARLGSDAMPPDEAATLFVANRKWMARILRSVDDSAFSRAGVQSELGRLTLAEILVKATHHLDHHLRFLYAKRAKLGVSIYPRYSSNPGT